MNYFLIRYPNIYSSAGMDMECFQSMICDNSFCAAYSEETRGAKPISETIPPEIDNTADLSHLFNLDDDDGG